jgi:hypothetical protein
MFELLSPLGSSPALLILALLFTLHVLASLAEAQQARKPSGQAEQERALAALRAQTKGLTPAQDMVKLSLLQRQIIKAEKEMAKGAEAAAAQSIDLATPLLWRLKPAAMVALALLFWGTPMARLPPWLLWPVPGLCARDGTLGVLPWLCACSAVAASAVPAAALMLGLPRKEAPKGILGMLGMGGS